MLNGVGQAELLEKQAQETPLEPGKFHQALEAARVAARLAEGASDKVRVRAKELVDRLELEETAAERDRRLLVALLEVRGPREGPKYQGRREGPDDGVGGADGGGAVRGSLPYLGPGSGCRAGVQGRRTIEGARRRRW